MWRLIFIFILLFYVTSFADEVKVIRGAAEKKPSPQVIDIIKEPAKPEPPEPLKPGEEIELAIIPAIKHCLTLEESISEHFKLIDAFNIQPDMEGLDKKLTEADRERLYLYLSGRNDIANFGFIITEQWRVTQRKERVKFNSIMNLKLSEKLGIKYGGFKFHGNCKASLKDEVEKKDNFSYARIDMPLAFDTNETSLTYVMVKQEGYNWIIDDLLINGSSLVDDYGLEIAETIRNEGIEKAISKLCKSSSFTTLKCE